MRAMFYSSYFNNSEHFSKHAGRSVTTHKYVLYHIIYIGQGSNELDPCTQVYTQIMNTSVLAPSRLAPGASSWPLGASS
jgi:hypothetical protein